MNRPSQNPRSREEIATAAAQWVLRRDRGLTAAEQDEFSQWLAADPRHGEALAEHRWGWDELDRLTGLQTSLGAVPDPDLFAPPARVRVSRRSWVAGMFALGAAAALVFVWLNYRTEKTAPITAADFALAAPCERRTLGDGSIVALNRGAVVEIAETAFERRVILVRGEASFTVAKDPTRPFIVSVGGVEVRAVGTAFNVRRDTADVEVIVTEGTVQVSPPAGSAAAAPFIKASQRVVVPIEKTVVGTPSSVTTLAQDALEARLAWHPQLLDFTDAPLADIVAAFNRRNPVRIVVADAALAKMRLSATFRSDNVDGFVRLMEANFAIKAEWRDSREIALRRGR